MRWVSYCFERPVRGLMHQAPTTTHAKMDTYSILVSMCRCVSLLILLFIGACVPATTPPQLAYTPGPSVQVTGNEVITEDFTVERPDGWRVITSAADAPPTLILVAPDDSALIVIATEGIGEPPRPQVDADTSLRDMVQTITLDSSQTLTVYMAGPAEDWPTLETLFEHLTASIR
jgi:hypothetical protein